MVNFLASLPTLRLDACTHIFLQFLVQSPDCFIFVSDFNPSRTPTGGGKKLYMTTSGNGTVTPPIYSREKSPASRQLLSGGSIK